MCVFLQRLRVFFEMREIGDIRLLGGDYWVGARRSVLLRHPGTYTFVKYDPNDALLGAREYIWLSSASFLSFGTYQFALSFLART